LSFAHVWCGENASPTQAIFVPFPKTFEFP